MGVGEDYERVLEAMGRHPEKKSSALSSVVELPRQRIRSWIDDGGMPDCYRGLQTALDQDWIIDSWEHSSARPLNALAAWVLASGSISNYWAPSFVVNSNTEMQLVLRLFDDLGLDPRFERESDPKWATEIFPRDTSTVLGR